MIAPITALDATFDAQKLFDALPQDVMQSEQFAKTRQLSITHSGDGSWFASTQRLYDREFKPYGLESRHFTTLNTWFDQTPMQEAVETVRQFAAQDGVKLGRIRLMTIKPLSCWVWHRDPEEFRYHIVLTTSPSCMLVVGNSTIRMPEIGRLYRFRTTEAHTAINAGLKADRHHIVFDTFV